MKLITRTNRTGTQHDPAYRVPAKRNEERKRGVNVKETKSLPSSVQQHLPPWAALLSTEGVTVRVSLDGLMGSCACSSDLFETIR